MLMLRSKKGLRKVKKRKIIRRLKGPKKILNLIKLIILLMKLKIKRLK